MKKAVIFILAIILLLSLFACSSSDKKQLVGSWQNSEYVLIIPNAPKVHWETTYSFSNDNTFMYESESEAFDTYSVEYGTYTIKSGIITLTYEDGDIETIPYYINEYTHELVFNSDSNGESNYNKLIKSRLS